LQQFEDPVPKELFQPFKVNLRQDVKPACALKCPVCRDGMQVRMEVHQVPEGLEGNDRPGYRPLIIQRARRNAFKVSWAH